METMVPKIYVLLESLRVKSTMQGAVSTPTILKRGWGASAVTSKTAVSSAQADFILGNKFLKTAAVIQVLGHEPKTDLIRQTAWDGSGPGIRSKVRVKSLSVMPSDLTTTDMGLADSRW